MEDSTTEATRASVDKMIDSFVDGELEHATEMLSTLWDILTTDGDIKAPLKPLKFVSPFRHRFLSDVTRQHLLRMISLRRSPPTGPM